MWGDDCLEWKVVDKTDIGKEEFMGQRRGGRIRGLGPISGIIYNLRSQEGKMIRTCILDTELKLLWDTK